MSERNYFEDLGLQPNATLDDVRKAFKRMALRYHPDHNPDDPRAEDLFRHIQEAYRNLNSENALQKMREIFEGSAKQDIERIETEKQGPKIHERRKEPKPKPAEQVCKSCRGKQEIQIRRGFFKWTKTCPECALASLPRKS